MAAARTRQKRVVICWCRMSGSGSKGLSNPGCNPDVPHGKGNSDSVRSTSSLIPSGW
jgi:hypothetical protein